MINCRPVMNAFEGMIGSGISGATSARGVFDSGMGRMAGGYARSRAFGGDALRVGKRLGKMGIGAGALGGIGYLGYKGYERHGRSSGANGIQGRSSGGMQ